MFLSFGACETDQLDEPLALLKELGEVIRETACKILSLSSCKLLEQWDNPANVRCANCKLGGGKGSDSRGRTRVSGVIIA